MTTPARYAPILEMPQVAAAEWGSWIARWLASGQKLFDCAAIVCAVYLSEVVALALRPHASESGAPIRLLYATAFALLFVALLDRHGGYRPCLSLLAIRETERLLRVTLQSFGLSLVAAYFWRVQGSRISVGCAVLLVPSLLMLERIQVHAILRRLRSSGYGTRRALILGTGSTARRLYTALVNSPKLGVKPVAFVEEAATATATEIYECSYRRRHSARVLRGPLTPEMYRELDISMLVIAEPALDAETMRLTLSEAAEIGVDAYFTTDEFAAPGSSVDYAEIDGIMLAHPAKGGSRALYEFGKRLTDVTLAGVAILLFAPAAALIAILVRKTSPGPVFFRQQRVGRAGRRFTMYKFRTMYEDAPQYGYSPGQVGDTRITPIGRLLRRTSLDEFPQLINVLLGQMSLVGPRPEMPFIVEQYTPMQRQRLTVKPGMTGLWQISADRVFLIHENIEYDLYYFRVNIVLLRVPPLRERVADIPILAEQLLRSITGHWGRGEIRISSSAMLALERYAWPGNIRELRNVLHRAALMAEGNLMRPEHLHFQPAAAPAAFAPQEDGGTLQQVERAYIRHVLLAERGSVERAARRLGIPRSSLYNKMRRFDIPQGTGRTHPPRAVQMRNLAGFRAELPMSGD